VLKLLLKGTKNEAQFHKVTVSYRTAADLLRAHDLTRELNAIGFNLDREAVDKGVSTCWGVAAQDKATRRKLTRLTDVKPIFEQARTTPPMRSSELGRRNGITAG
jgi:hypothetical protein